MSGENKYKPFYSQFITEIAKGISLLEETSKSEVEDFMKSCQLANGAFSNRAGTADLYYSLFGAWLCKALGSDQIQGKLKKYVSGVNSTGEKVVDRFSLLLIRLIVEEKKFQKPSFVALLRWVLKDAKSLNAAYRFFLFMLSFDALYGPNRLVKLVIRIPLMFYKTTDDLPCSFYAALLLAKFITGKNVEQETAVLLGYFEKGMGFKVFREQPDADLLSTAVALFALKKSGADLRLVAPDCLKLAEENFDNGAFLSGDGDLSRDLEYTFYGLLILGVLS